LDDILLENNNPLVNSDDEYLIYKNNYFEQSKINYELYTKKSKELLLLTKSEYDTFGTRYIYTYIDKTYVANLKIEIKNIILEQRRLLNNLIHYTNSLNTKYKNFSKKTKETKIKNFFSKFLDGTKSNNNINIAPRTLSKSNSVISDNSDDSKSLKNISRSKSSNSFTSNIKQKNKKKK
jgi:hypothetical protein